MGLTIHYKFSLKNATITQAREKVVALRNLALRLPFQSVDELVEIEGDACHFDKNNFDDPHAFIKIRALKPIEIAMNGFSWENPTYIIGFDSLPGEGSETPIFGLASHSSIKDINDWSWTSFCKTQYASNPEYGGLENFLKCHLLIVKMLDAACELGITCDVSDETGYWENRNIEELARIIRQHNVLIAALTGKIKDDLAEEGIVSQSPIFDYPDFEYLEAEGKQLPDFKS
ncbi:hypothetical protein [Calothrix sp. PCC 6303]|uniref:hypothetical protein n=1 Tax=Calothrix sp. PCC 6303 TaxID=1170562 RepID=UPI0002A03DFA|nr:hypothetical protein [Calothrix sp. PCC 6303]AFZ04584.1 hypothetical protein Cal6303_5715 [Calothrix sp. PCC 6303]